jgi:D-alanyl-lipoteichoic acid acyltransferase DltB (MBOAT superfamily)
MTFTELPFVILLAITYPLWLLCRRHERLTIGILLIASLVFYAHDDWPLLFLLAAYGLVDWLAGRSIARARRPRLALALGVGFNLAGLAFWKYGAFFASMLRFGASSPAAVDPAAANGGWVVPFGISFYSFTGIAYLVDVYRGTITAEPNIFRYLLHVSFFPHLMAGPILRAREFLVHLRPGALPRRAEAPAEAALLLARGYFKKMVLADRIALAIDPFFAHVGTPATAGVWGFPYLCLYAFQIYFDFSGYTDIARGLAMLFGFRWPENFDLPYLATSPRDFWRRWHITLSRFLRDYLYIPLGGNRRGALRAAVSIMITMLLGGLWHGASWTFVVWGGLHGAYLVAERVWTGSHAACVLRRHVPALPWRLLSIGATFALVCLTWSFFRLTELGRSLACLRSCVVFDVTGLLASDAGDASLWILLTGYGASVLAGGAVRAALQAAPWREDLRAGSLARGFAWGTALAGLVLALVLSPNETSPPFIYFEF